MLAKEMEILVSLGFNVHVQLPYALLIHYLRLLSLESDEEVTQCAWSYLNDAWVYLLVPACGYLTDGLLFPDLASKPTFMSATNHPSSRAWPSSSPPA
jgi:hypothetical protein